MGFPIKVEIVTRLSVLHHELSKVGSYDVIVISCLMPTLVACCHEKSMSHHVSDTMALLFNALGEVVSTNPSLRVFIAHPTPRPDIANYEPCVNLAKVRNNKKG